VTTLDASAAATFDSRTGNVVTASPRSRRARPSTSQPVDKFLRTAFPDFPDWIVPAVFPESRSPNREFRLAAICRSGARRKNINTERAVRRAPLPTTPRTMFAARSVSPVARVRSAPRAPERTAQTPTRALFTKEKPATQQRKRPSSGPNTRKNQKPVATKTGKRLSQEESVKEMSSVVAQAFALGLAVPVGVVGAVEASKTVAPDQDVGLYGFAFLAVGCAAWWGGKTAERDALRNELERKGLDMSTVDNIAVLKWVKQQDDLGKGKQAVRQIYRAYETEANPWSPFFKPAGVGKDGPKK